MPFNIGHNGLRSTRDIWFLMFFVVVSSWFVEGITAAPCTLCEHGPAQVPNPKKVVGSPDDFSTATTCGSLQSASAPLVVEGSPYCDGIRTVGTFCGCNVPPNSCSLCWDGSRTANPSLELPDYQARDLVPLSPIDTSLTCESLESFLHTLGENDAQCLEVQEDVGERCGCPPSPSSTTGGEPQPLPSNSTNRNATEQEETDSTAPVVEETTDNNDDPKQVQEPRQSCSPCLNREDSIMFPDRPLTAGSLPVDSCADLEFFASLLLEDDVHCAVMRAVGFYCGCPRPPDACTLCPNGESAPRPSQPSTMISRNLEHLPAGFEDVADSLTCGLMEGFVASNSAELLGMDSDLLCLSTQLKSWVCGCSPDWKQILLTWAYRLSGLLSLLGSTLIMVDIFRKRKNQFTTYHQLMIGVSFFDCISSLAYMMVGVMAPVDDGFYLSRGNDATCTAQGVMIQIGQTSAFYNMCLSLYFLLVIGYNWKEHQFKKIGRWVHLVVVLLGVSMGFGAIPYILPQFGMCGILQAPDAVNVWPVTIFHTVPISITLVILTAATIAICVKVHQQQVKAKKWMLQQNLSLTRKVVWQSVWYVIAFYATFPFLIVFSHYAQLPMRGYFTIFVVAAALRPCQGFLNALVYFQRSRGKAIFNFLFVCLKRAPSEGEKRDKRLDFAKGHSAAPTANESKQTLRSSTSLRCPDFVVLSLVAEDDEDDNANPAVSTTDCLESCVTETSSVSPTQLDIAMVAGSQEAPPPVATEDQAIDEAIMNKEESLEVAFSAVLDHWRLNELDRSLIAIATNRTGVPESPGSQRMASSRHLSIVGRTQRTVRRSMSLGMLAFDKRNSRAIDDSDSDANGPDRKKQESVHFG